jgi:hypothetical protein
MRRQHNRRHQHRAETQQFDLFKGVGNEKQQRPQWDALPTETRQALAELMARLILDHKGNGRHPLKGETRHDI